MSVVHRIEGEKLWCEAYRPHDIANCILPAKLKSYFSTIVSTGEMPNLLLCGKQGTGKTSVSQALCKSMGMDYIQINGSEDSGIDVLRGKIRQFASSVSLETTGKVKVVILDEADYLTTHTQTALRGFIEEFSNNCRFILTCNFKNRVIEPLHSRCAVVEFTTDKKTLADLSGKFMSRLQKILETEHVKFDPKVLAELIWKFAPDWRRVLNECQRYSITGTIDSGILASLADANIEPLMKALKEKDFKSMRGWVVQNADMETPALFRKVYDNMAEYLEPQSIPQVVLILADYSYKAAFCADAELNCVACLTEIMANASWV